MTVATLRPNADRASHNFDSIVGAATCWQAWADDSDSSYASSDGSPSYQAGYVELTTFTLPTGAVVTQNRLRVRVDGDSTFSRVYGRVYDYTSSRGDFVYFDETVIGLTSGFVEYVSAWNQGSDKLPSTQAIIDTGYAHVGLHYAGKISEIYWDIMYVAKPVTVVTAVSPDPYTASNFIPVEWTNTLDSDGGAQTRYEVKVFTDAQYGAGGFSPDTSTSIWTTGVVISSGTSVTAGPLPTGDTYRVYVRTAQTVNGAEHWSAWAYDQFDVNVATADIGSVTPVADSANARVGVTVARTGATAWNFIEVQRSIDGGTTWEYVRGAAYVDATGNANSFVVQDYEVGNGVSVKYRSRATRIAAGLPITGAWVESTAITSWSSSGLWLKDPLNPAVNGTFRLETTVSPEYTLRQGVYSVLGRDTPIVVSDVRSSATGVIVLLATSKAVSTAILALTQSPILLLQVPSSWDMQDMYIALGSVVQERSVKVRTPVARWSLPFVEVDAPLDITAGV